jgi:hypothetical protein
MAEVEKLEKVQVINKSFDYSFDQWCFFLNSQLIFNKLNEMKKMVIPKENCTNFVLSLPNKMMFDIKSTKNK